MKIIMVCTGNTCRSPMAEALMQRALTNRGLTSITVLSGGTSAHPGSHISANAAAQLIRMGLDLRRHRAMNIYDMPLNGALVLCMTDAHLRAVKRIDPTANAHTLMAYAGLPDQVDDPFGMGPATYERCALQMQRAIDIIANKLKEGM